MFLFLRKKLTHILRGTSTRNGARMRQM